MDISGHDGVEVDDAEAPVVLVEQHIVELGIVVGDPQGDLPLFAQPFDGHHLFGPVEDELHIVLNSGSPVLRVFLQHFVEIVQPHLHVVEAGQHLVYPRGVQSCDQHLKTPDGPASLISLSGGLYLVVAAVPFDEDIGPPVISLVIPVKELSVGGGDDREGLPVGVGSRDGGEFFPDVRSDLEDIVLQLLHIFEDIGIDPLQDIVVLILFCGGDLVGVVDMTGAERFSFQESTFASEMTEYVSQICFHACFSLRFPDVK